MSSRLVVAAFAFGAAGVFLNSASFADLTTDTSATDANDLGEVVVTAQRKEESVQTTVRRQAPHGGEVRRSRLK
ncbi:MAG: hypothetical protein ACLQO1_24280 [Steroidobacteraceae bacterium]